MTGIPRGGPERARVRFGSLLITIVAAFLSACSDDDAGPAAPYKCEVIANSNPSLTTASDPGCAGCSITDAAAAADDALQTASVITVEPLAPNDGVVLTLKAQPGVVFPNTYTPGYHYSASSGETCVEIRTYLNGSLNNGSSTLCGVTTTGDEIAAVLVGVSDPFDAVELAVGSYGAAGSLRINEVCVNE